MTKKERLEDLGRLYVMLKQITEDDFFTHADSKHGFEDWKREHHDKEEYGEPKGLYSIFCQVRHLRDRLYECQYIAAGFDDEH